MSRKDAATSIRNAMMRAIFSFAGFFFPLLYAVGAAAQVPIFADNFESGDPLAWSNIVPDPFGRSCPLPADVSSSPSAYTLQGTFRDDPSTGPSCDTTPNNAVWFAYTPSMSGEYEITATNSTSTLAYSRLAVFEGTSCDPYGTQLFCQTRDSKTITSATSLEAGTSYLIMFFTDGEVYTMVDPDLEIIMESVPPGTTCPVAVDVSNASFPYQLAGTFDDDPSIGGSCDTTPNNAVWYTYTPSVTDQYEITATNNSPTNAWSRLAVFEGTSCDPYGSEMFCEATNGKTITSARLLNAGTSYRIVFFTDGELYTMVDPEIDIATVP